MVAVDTCHGVRGVIQAFGEAFYVEPRKEFAMDHGRTFVPNEFEQIREPKRG